MATTAIDVDPRRAASHRSMVEHLTAPFAAGAIDTELEIDAAGGASAPWRSREPLLLAAPKRPLAGSAIRLRAEVTTTATRTASVEFAPYTEPGAFLPLWWLPADAQSRTVAGITVKLKATSRPKIEDAELADWFELRLVEGILGRTLYLLGAEAARLRRVGREISAMRVLGSARDDALDRTGADLSVPRLADRLVFKNGALQTETARESDDDYRRRLGIFRPLRLRTFHEVRELLNGPGADGDPNRGPVGALAAAVPAAKRPTYEKRFEVVERDNEFAIGIALAAGGDPALRDNFFEFIRATRLVWPGSSAAGNAAHAKRLLPSDRAARETRLRAELGALFDTSTFDAGPEPAVAPMLASALVRAARCIGALGGPTPWPLFRAQHPDRGSRYELGLGVAAKQLTPGQLNALGAAHGALAAADPEFGQVADPDPSDPSARRELRALLRSLKPEGAAADPDGRWLLEPCGLRTVHRLPQAGAPWPIVYLSHFPVFGMTVTLPASTLQVGGWTIAVDGSFAPRAGAWFAAKVFAYERDEGAGSFWAAGWGSPLTSTGRVTGLRKTWSQILAGRFSAADGADELLFYDAASGEVELRATDGTQLTTTVGVTQNVRKTWSHLVAYGAGDRSRVFAYDRAQGIARLFAVNEQGKLASLGPEQTGLRRTWTHIVALDTPAGYSDLFFYDASAGDGEVFTPEEAGTLRRESPLHTGLGTWSHVVPGVFGASARREGLLFYDRGSGRSLRLDADLERLGEPRLGPGWSSIVPLQLGGVELTQPFLYDRLRGRGELWGYTGDLQLLRAFTQSDLPAATAHEAAAHFHAPGDPGSNVVLAQGVANALARWQALGGQDWSVLTDNQARARWALATPRPANDPALETFREAALPAVEDPAPVVEKLKAIPPELIDTVVLDPALSQAIVTHAAGAAGSLRGILGLLEDERIVSALPLVTGASEVALVLGVLPLPVAGTNLYEEVASGFRWYVVPIQGDGGAVRATGSRTQLQLDGPGLSAVVALGYARHGFTAPYEFRVDLPADGLLTMAQYELLMNLLEHVYPAGVRVNTYAIRRRHVDLGLSGAAATLDPTTSRTYRAFRRRRHRGETSVTLPDE